MPCPSGTGTAGCTAATRRPMRYSGTCGPGTLETMTSKAASRSAARAAKARPCRGSSASESVRPATGVACPAFFARAVRAAITPSAAAGSRSATGSDTTKNDRRLPSSDDASRTLTGHERLQVVVRLPAPAQRRAERDGGRGEQDVVHRRVLRPARLADRIQACVCEGDDAPPARSAIQRGARGGSQQVAQDATRLARIARAEAARRAGRGGQPRPGRQERRTPGTRAPRTPGRRRIRDRIGLGVEQQRRDLDRGDAVDERVVHLADERPAAARQAVDDAHPPQRSRGIQRRREQHARRCAQLALPAGRGERERADVVRDVERRVVLPAARARRERRRDETAAQLRHAVQARREVPAQPAERGRGPVEADRPPDVQRRAVRVEIEERTIEGTGEHGASLCGH